jgi:hypothetical protein
MVFFIIEYVGSLNVDLGVIFVFLIMADMGSLHEN